MELIIDRFNRWDWGDGDPDEQTSFNDWSCIRGGAYYCGSLSSPREPQAAKPGRKERRAYERRDRKDKKKKGRKGETPILSVFLPKYGEGVINHQKIKNCFKWQKIKKKVGKHAKQKTSRDKHNQIPKI